MDTCPKCTYQRQPSDATVHAGICPSCGIAYAKYRAAAAPASPDPAADGSPPYLSETVEETFTLRQRLVATLTYVPDQTDSTVFWGRAALFGLFVIWGASFILAGIDWEKLGGSFLHNVNLAFHEFGHVLFSPFGRFMTILGGSLFQVLLPLIFVGAFSFQMRDNYAAAICLWWCGQSFMDVAPYIRDAEFRALPLVGGMGESSHDWGNLLTMTDSIHRASSLANASFFIGTVIMLLSFYWGGLILYRQYRSLE